MLIELINKKIFETVPLKHKLLLFQIHYMMLTEWIFWITLVQRFPFRNERLNELGIEPIFQFSRKLNNSPFKIRKRNVAMV